MIHNKHTTPIYKTILLSILILAATGATGQHYHAVADTIVYNNNIFTVRHMGDTTTMLNEETGEVNTIIKHPFPVPVMINSYDIFDKTQVEQLPNVTENTIKFFLLHKLGNKITNLADGEYRLKLYNIVIDKNGRIAYHDFMGIEKNAVNNVTGSTQWQLVQSLQTGAMGTVVKKILEQSAHTYTPAMLYGKPVNVLLSDEEFATPFFVQDGLVTHQKL